MSVALHITADRIEAWEAATEDLLAAALAAQTTAGKALAAAESDYRQARTVVRHLETVLSILHESGNAVVDAAPCDAQRGEQP